MLSTDVDTRDNICTASLWRYVSWCYSKHQIGSSRHQDRAEQFETSLPIEKEKRRCIVSHLCAIIFELGWQIGFVMKVFGSQSNCRRHWRRRRQQKKKATRKKRHNKRREAKKSFDPKKERRRLTEMRWCYSRLDEMRNMSSKGANPQRPEN